MQTDAVLEHLKTLDRTEVTLAEVVQYIRDNRSPQTDSPDFVWPIAFYLIRAFRVGIKDALGIAAFNVSYSNLTIDEAEKAIQKI